MLTHEEIDAFYKRVGSLNLRFPVAAITEATGESKANVSKILNRKMLPSEGFLKRFYKKFPESSKIVSRDTSEKESLNGHIPTNPDLSALIENNGILTRTIEKAQDNISKCQEDQRELIQMLKEERAASTGRAPARIDENLQTQLTHIHSLIAKVGVAAKLWGNEGIANEEISKGSFEILNAQLGMGNANDKRKLRK